MSNQTVAQVTENVTAGILAQQALHMEPYKIRFSSAVREAQNKQGAPFAGFPIPGAAPIAVSRKLLKSCLDGLTAARVAVQRANEAPLLLIESLDGRRHYRIYCKHAALRTGRSDAQRAVRDYANRKRASLASKNGWRRVVSFDEETGERSEYSEKNGLRVQGRVLLHAASGKSILSAENHSKAFVWAEQVLDRFPDWTQDAESLFAMLGDSGRAIMAGLRTRAQYGL